MPRSEFLLIVVLIILSASIGLAHDQSDFVRFELCANDDEHARDRELLSIRKSQVSAIQKSSKSECVIISSTVGRKVRVYAPDPHRPVSSMEEFLEND